jgi:hypothetical protein
MKICPVGAELFHADRRTEMTKLIVAFHDFANAPKNVYTSSTGTAETLAARPGVLHFCATLSFAESPAFRKLSQVLRHSTLPTRSGIPRQSPIQLLTMLKVA